VQSSCFLRGLGKSSEAGLTVTDGDEITEQSNISFKATVKKQVPFSAFTVV